MEESRQRLKFAFLYCAYLILAVVLIAVFVEALLGLGFLVTGGSAFETLVRNYEHPYPDDPAGYLKIAIFGGSAAAGWASE